MFMRLAHHADDLLRHDEDSDAILALTEGMDYDDIVVMVAGVLQEMLTDGTPLPDIIDSFEDVRTTLCLDAADIRRKFH
jgi:hypothetical protein